MDFSNITTSVVEVESLGHDQRTRPVCGLCGGQDANARVFCVLEILIIKFAHLRLIMIHSAKIEIMSLHYKQDSLMLNTLKGKLISGLVKIAIGAF